MPEPLLTRVELAAVSLASVLVVALVAVGWLALVVARQRRELEELRRSTVREQPASRTKVAAGWAVRTVIDTAARVRERGFFEGVLMSPIEDIARWAGEERATIEQLSAPDGTVTILFSDIECSTQLNEELGDDKFVKLLAEHDRLVRGQVERHGGSVVKSQGDGFMVVFGSPGDALAAARGIQRKAAGGRRARRAQVRVRIGINCGTVVSRDGDYFGRNVAKAARIAALADGGQILVSDEVRSGLGDDAELEPAGTVELRGLAGEHDLYAVAS